VSRLILPVRVSRVVGMYVRTTSDGTRTAAWSATFGSRTTEDDALRLRMSDTVHCGALREPDLPTDGTQRPGRDRGHDRPMRAPGLGGSVALRIPTTTDRPPWRSTTVWSLRPRPARGIPL